MAYKGQALGLIQTIGMVPALYGTDLMLKEADVELVGYENIGSTLVAVMIRGDVAAVRAAVEVGKYGAASIGTLTGHNVMPRPIAGVHQIVSLHGICPEPIDVYPKALGLIETFGIVNVLEAADAMVKASNTVLIGYENVASGYISVLVEGDVAACHAAVNAGVAAVQKMGEDIYSSVVIPAPHPTLTKIIERYSLDILLS